MHSRLREKIIHLVCLGIMSVFFSACQDTMPYVSTIAPDASISGNSSGCTSAQTEVTAADGTVSCVDKTTIRPDNAIKFKTDFCGCKDGKAVTYGNCNSFCSAKNTNGAGILYANFNVTEDISLNSTLTSVKGWCNIALPDEPTNPRCALKAKDDDGNEVLLDVETGSNNNALTINIDKLSEDKIYVLTLVETVSGAKSDSIQIVKYSSDLPISILGPLKNAPVTQFTCLKRPASPDVETNFLYYDSAFRIHFYFLPRIPPNPIPPGTDLVCHDFLNTNYGLIDDILYPRLEQIPGIFNLWDKTDPRFYDNDGNGKTDINELIIQKAKSFANITLPSTINFFMPFEVSIPTVTSESGSGNNSGSSTSTPTSQILGYYMLPWIDPTTYRSYCLNSSHYNSSNPLYKAMRDIIGVDMEGIYVGKKAPEVVYDRLNNVVTGPDDYLLIRETDLKQVWFYFKNGVPTVPSDSITYSDPVWFYYPLNKASPFVKSSTQRLYQITGSSELRDQNISQNASTSTGLSTLYPPHDNKIGCIPKF